MAISNERQPRALSSSAPKERSNVRRLAVLNTHPIQYFAPLYRRLALEADIDLTVYYCSRQGLSESFDRGFGRTIAWNIPLVEGYAHKFLANEAPSQGSRRGFFQFVNPGIVAELYRERYDAIWLHAYNYCTSMLAFCAARLFGTRILYRTESSLIYDRMVKRPLWLRLAKTVFLRTYLSQVDRCLAIGTRNREFYNYYGQDSRRIDDVPYTVDNQFFQREADAWRPRRDAQRKALGLPLEAVVFIFAAKLITEKRPLEVIKAFASLGAAEQAVLLIAGDGMLAAECRSYAARMKLTNVVFTGFVNQKELPRYYALSDVLVHAADPCKGDWGLTVNEAMACGLAIIASEGVGAAIDLVQRRGTGLMVPCGSTEALAAAMSYLLDGKVCTAMGAASKRVIATWDYERCVRGIRQALGATDEG